MSGCSAASLSTFALSEMSNACTSARTFQREAMLSRTASRSACVRETRMTLTPSSASTSAEAATDALRGAGDQRRPAAQIQVHDVLLLIHRAASSSCRGLGALTRAIGLYCHCEERSDAAIPIDGDASLRSQ